MVFMLLPLDVAAVRILSCVYYNAKCRKKAN